MNRRIALPLSAIIAALVIGIGSMAADQGLITFRSVIFDTTFLQGQKGTPRLDDIVLANLKEEITLRGVFAAQPKYHVDICMLIEAKHFAIVTIPPHLIKAFDDNIYSDAVLRLKDDSLCRVQHSYKEADGVTIRLVRDNAIAYIKPNEADAGDGK